MRSPGFHWFVAWRYLMARPRRLSGTILVFIAVFAGLWATSGLAVGLDPVTDEFLAAGAPLPPWMPLSFGAMVALAGTAYWAAAIWLGWFGGGPRPRAARLIAGAVLLLAVAVAWVSPRDPVLAARFPLLPFDPAFAELLLALPFELVPLAIFLARPRAIPRWAPVSILLGGLAALGQLAVLSAATEGDFLANLPGLVDAAPPYLAAPVLVPIAAAIAALVAARAAQAPAVRAGRLRLAGLAGAMAVAGLAFCYWLLLTRAGIHELVLTATPFRPPVSVTIISNVAGALFTLLLVFLGIRYLSTFFTTVSMGGVAIGTMALVVTLSVMSGFEADLRSKILGSNAHILVTRHDEAPFTGYRAVIDKVVQVPGVVAETPYLTSEVVIAGSSTYFNVVIKGIDPRTIARVTDLGQDLDDEEALDRMWPLADDGGVTGPPPDAGPSAAAETPEGAADPAPEDLEVGGGPPTDWSGGGSAAPPAAPAPPAPTDPAAPAPTDPAPTDLHTDDTAPTDWSGGRTEALPEAEPSREPLVDADEDVDGADQGADESEDEGEDDEPHAGWPVGKGKGRGRHLGDGDWLPPPARELDPHVAALPGVLVGRELEKQINLYNGQEVKIISPLGQNTVIGQTPYIKPYRVAGTFFTGMYEYDLKRVYVELGTLQDFLDLPDAATGIEIRVRDPEDTDSVIAGLRSVLGPDYTVQDWKELNRSLFSALKLEKIAMFLVLAIIILVASFSIVGNLIMVVVEKAREIAVLKTLGASDAGVTRIFVVQGFFIGLVGTSIGVLLGLVVCYLADRFGVGIPPDVYYIDRLPIHVEPTTVALVAAAGVLISVAATIYPAQIAARLRPVQGLRYE